MKSYHFILLIVGASLGLLMASRYYEVEEPIKPVTMDDFKAPVFAPQQPESVRRMLEGK